MSTWLYVLLGAGGALGLRALYRRLLLSRGKHRSLLGHARMARRVARLIPFYEYQPEHIFGVDGAPADIVDSRRAAFFRLAEATRTRAPRTLTASRELEPVVSDVAFTNAYRVPFQFRNFVKQHLEVGLVREASKGRQVQDLDGNWSYDLTGSYGVNVFGLDYYKQCIRDAVADAEALGPILGPYHPVVGDNARRLAAISGLDEVSFHMSGTEAVMQAVRLARYHTGRSHIVRFCGAYHGWWDGVQAGVGNPRPAREVYTLEDMSEAALVALRTRRNVACVLINPLQALHPNSGAPADSSLVNGGRKASFDKSAYSAWLQRLRDVCTERGIVLIFDEVFLGFRLALGGAQEYFGVRADMVTYGKTLGGGLPIGVVCGRSDLMKRFRPSHPTDICFARGTFNSHPYVMTAMDRFLRFVETAAVRDQYTTIDATWNARAERFNQRLESAGLPMRVANMVSIFTTLYLEPSRYNWMYQYYLRAEGLTLSWVGSGRFIFSHDYTDAEVDEVIARFVRAGEKMRADGWLWHSADASNRGIQRTLLRELLRARFGKRPA
ncbi:MAG: aminotransferase class III-fold pyridoxal phosphate-dependent enzyme [Planctomycetota bacterium]